uniref:(northern house mosquito) hypothetical protein n=1 Tax=Culex pipiens TaxID=7175 RepID=A0A8D8FBD2_CULPI
MRPICSNSVKSSSCSGGGSCRGWSDKAPDLSVAMVLLVTCVRTRSRSTLWRSSFASIESRRVWRALNSSRVMKMDAWPGSRSRSPAAGTAGTSSSMHSRSNLMPARTVGTVNCWRGSLSSCSFQFRSSAKFPLLRSSPNAWPTDRAAS